MSITVTNTAGLTIGDVIQIAGRPDRYRILKITGCKIEVEALDK